MCEREFTYTQVHVRARITRMILVFMHVTLAYAFACHISTHDTKLVYIFFFMHMKISSAQTWYRAYFAELIPSVGCPRSRVIDFDANGASRWITLKKTCQHCVSSLHCAWPLCRDRAGENVREREGSNVAEGVQVSTFAIHCAGQVYGARTPSPKHSLCGHSVGSAHG